MCGIAGILERRGRRADPDLLLTMAHELAHRGPDGVGLYLDSAVGLVNTRLAIVDLEGGDQPLTNETGRYWVVQNGEIYNAPELRDELTARGHRFSTRCDTEVLVHAYEEWGTNSLDRLNGAFAFAIWDRREEQLFVARDRFGIRPLFVAEADGALLFASECKALLRHPGLARELDPLGLVEALQLWSTGPDRSAFTGIRELPPGHAMLAGPGIRPRTWCWWSVDFAPPEPERTEPEAELAAELLDLLADSTRLRLRADVPVGAYLSGGLDSSAITALVRRGTEQPVRCLGLQFRDPLFDERAQQAQVAAALGIPLDTVEVGSREIADAFGDVVRFAEKPLLRTAPAPLMLLSRRARESGLKVVLTGEGADEVFAGYGIFREDKVRRFWARQPSSTTRPRLLGKLYPYLANDLGKTGAFGHAFFGRGLTDTDDPLYSHRIRFRNGLRVLQLLHPDTVAGARAAGDPEARLIARLPAHYDRFSPLGRAQLLETVTFLQGYLLHSQGDRMLMANSVEGRFPFLDHRLIEFAARLPDRSRLRGLREKHLLRCAVAPLLPAETTSRPKRPYRAPIHRTFLGPEAPEWVGDLLGEGALAAAGVFEPRRVAGLVAKCRRSLERGVSEVDEMGLVAVVSTMLLHRQLVATPPAAASATPTRVVRGDGRGGASMDSDPRQGRA